jgi:hypothetical protein
MTGNLAAIRNLSADVERLAAWFRLNKPDVSVIRVTPQDLKRLRKNPQIAAQHGFSVGEAMRYGEFELKEAP